MAERKLGSTSGAALAPSDVAAVADAFWKRVERRTDSDCWPWSGGFRSQYGSLWIPGRGDVQATRISVALSGRYVPAGMVALHSCDNPKCVNPRHLKVGTQLENKLDAIAKGRSRGAVGDANIARKHPEKFQGERNGRAKLTAVDVSLIRKLASKGLRQRELAEMFSVGKTTVGMLLRGETWRNA